MRPRSRLLIARTLSPDLPANSSWVIPDASR
jgi:hypothetical protein